VGCTSRARSLCSTISQRCSIGLRSGDCGAILVQWAHCHVQETNLKWFEVCGMVHYPAGSSHQSQHGGHKGMETMLRLWQLNNVQLALRGLKCANIPHTITPPPPAVVTRHDRSKFTICLHQILSLPAECLNRN